MRAEISINRPVETVYAFFLDLERNIASTDPRVESVIKVTEGVAGPGTTFVIRQPMFGRVREQRMWITHAELNRSIGLAAAFGPVRPQLRLAFEPTSTGSTLVTMTGDSRPIGPLRLVAFAMDRVGMRNWNRRLRLIKAALEA